MTWEEFEMMVLPGIQFVGSCILVSELLFSWRRSKRLSDKLEESKRDLSDRVAEERAKPEHEREGFLYQGLTVTVIDPKKEEENNEQESLSH